MDIFRELCKLRLLATNELLPEKWSYQDWRFTSFYNSYTIKFANIPDAVVGDLQRASYFADPSALIYDIKLDIIPQWDHILYDEENFLRIPEQLRANGKEFCQNIISGAIGSVKKRIEANYKTVVPLTMVIPVSPLKWRITMQD